MPTDVETALNKIKYSVEPGVRDSFVVDLHRELVLWLRAAVANLPEKECTRIDQAVRLALRTSHVTFLAIFPVPRA